MTLVKQEGKIIARSATQSLITTTGIVTLATVARAALAPLIGMNDYPFITYFAAVLICTLNGGVRDGLLGLALSAIASTYFFIAPSYSLDIPSRADQVAIFIFVVFSGGIIWVGNAQVKQLERIRRLNQELTVSDKKLRHSEQQARKARDWLETTLASIGDAVIVTDGEGKVTLLNAMAATLTGWREDDAIGRPLQEVFIITNEESGALVESPVVKALREGTTVGLANHTQLTARNGKQIPIDDSAAPIRDSDGKINGVVMVFRDVTDRKNAEKAAASRAEELRIANETLERANEDLKQFAYTASHDLQEPLRMVTAFSQLLLQGAKGQLDDEAEISVRYITEGAKRMRNLLADLLDYTRLSSDAQEVATPVDFHLVEKKAQENLSSAIHETNAVITAGELPLLSGYEPHFVQLLQNLIGNAIKYRSERTPEISISAEQQDSMWRFAVRDNGIGIAPEYHKQIFGVFKRLHGTQIPGTGIGLAICQRVVERYGGKIWVDSEPGQGATFYFTLPGNSKG